MSFQSPVDLGSAVEREPEALTIQYHKSVMHGEDRGSTLAFPVAGGSSVTYAGHRYELKEFHFHAPSEHTVRGQHAAAEVHFVNESSDGNFAVVAVLIEESNEVGGAHGLDQAMAMKSLLPESTTRYAYEGSLTTAPYTEGVQWIVLTDRMEFNPDWLTAFQDRYGSNNRPLQPEVLIMLWIHICLRN